MGDTARDEGAKRPRADDVKCPARPWREAPKEGFRIPSTRFTSIDDVTTTQAQGIYSWLQAVTFDEYWNDAYEACCVLSTPAGETDEDNEDEDSVSPPVAAVCALCNDQRDIGTLCSEWLAAHANKTRKLSAKQAFLKDAVFTALLFSAEDADAHAAGADHQQKIAAIQQKTAVPIAVGLRADGGNVEQLASRLVTVMGNIGVHVERMAEKNSVDSMEQRLTRIEQKLEDFEFSLDAICRHLQVKKEPRKPDQSGGGTVVAGAGAVGQGGGRVGKK
jgi:hypothetical protein